MWRLMVSRPRSAWRTRRAPCPNAATGRPRTTTSAGVARVTAPGSHGTTIDNLPLMQHEQPFRPVARIDRHVGAQAEHAELIDPGVIAGFGAPRRGHALELRQGLRIKRPAFGTVLTRCRRSIERSLALPAVEARQMSARERRPVDAAAVHVSAA